ncbi:MAG: RhuM family protein [Bacteroidota bacterium]|nr:RhuM family protein [Bacteroidota bacterium]
MNEILIYDNNVEIEVNYEDKTFWLDAHRIAKLFDRDRTVIVRHINNIYKTKELSQNSTCAKNAQVAKDGKIREMNRYNLDVIIAVGYRVNSAKGTKFRVWATKILNDYLVQGYAINEKRLEQKNQEIRHLKTGIRILNRAIESKYKGL